MNNVTIGNKIIGDGNNCRFVAEVGSFFNKDIDLAIEYLSLAAEAGVDVFKTEILHDPNICLDSANYKVTYKTAISSETENYRKFIERKVVKLSDYEKLLSHADTLGVPVMATVFDEKGLNFLQEHGGAAIKISRNNIRHKSLVSAAAKTKLPLIFDLGDVLESEAFAALELANRNGNTQVIFNYHPIFNPASANEHDLNSIRHYKNFLKTPVGLSCHYAGDLMMYVAIGAGANLIEKGVDHDPSRSEADLVSASSFRDLRSIVENIKFCSQALGNERPLVDKRRLKNVEPGLISSKEIRPGEVFTNENIAFAWPAQGINAEFVDLVTGMMANRYIKQGEIISWKDVTSA